MKSWREGVDSKDEIILLTASVPLMFNEVMVGGNFLENGHAESEMRVRRGEGVKAVERQRNSEALLDSVRCRTLSTNSSRNGAGLLSPIEEMRASNSS